MVNANAAKLFAITDYVRLMNNEKSGIRFPAPSSRVRCKSLWPVIDAYLNPRSAYSNLANPNWLYEQESELWHIYGRLGNTRPACTNPAEIGIAFLYHFSASFFSFLLLSFSHSVSLITFFSQSLLFSFNHLNSLSLYGQPMFFLSVFDVSSSLS